MTDAHDNGEKHLGGKHRGKHHHHGRHGAQTFRRGRALEFLDRLEVKRTVLKQQLDAPEYQAIRDVVLGELKAIETIIHEYTRHFELHRAEEPEPHDPTDQDQADNEEGDSSACGR